MHNVEFKVRREPLDPFILPIILCPYSLIYVEVFSSIVSNTLVYCYYHSSFLCKWDWCDNRPGRLRENEVHCDFPDTPSADTVQAVCNSLCLLCHGQKTCVALLLVGLVPLGFTSATFLLYNSLVICFMLWLCVCLFCCPLFFDLLLLISAFQLCLIET